ncbi:metal ABC transporter ATPase [Corynebacterium suranareeae]|uniref:Metal ABC transporter ATPase n=1 Tax=Corynebacterium suranareeae TaxID=2506452 RepID=A0A169RLL4_9CORY|nr:zinc ABC transporter ATP-binding protein AztA [Corynebacterium suranareeae]BAU94282.1 metal ABC transporter ATPase [Corynebacterium suranareeae]
MADLRVGNLTCAYGNHIALNNISARFPTGQITALIGSNGSGKSTLLEALAGTLKPRAGSIDNLAPNIAFVPQRSHVSHTLPITVRQTVNMGRWSARKTWQRLTAKDRNIVDSCLELLGILDLADRPLGEISGGQRQRTLIAQGLAQQAPLLLLDEPLTAVDSHAAHLIDMVINNQRSQGVTVIVATHHLDQANYADQVIELDKGHIKSQRNASTFP